MQPPLRVLHQYPKKIRSLSLSSGLIQGGHLFIHITAIWLASGNGDDDDDDDYDYDDDGQC